MHVRNLWGSMPLKRLRTTGLDTVTQIHISRNLRHAMKTAELFRNLNNGLNKDCKTLHKYVFI